MNQVASVLVTGGTGTFGRAFVRYLLQHTDTPRICVYSRNEHTQANAREAVNELDGATNRVRWMVGDTRDLKRLTRAMRGCDTVIHAAALKRIEVGQYNPDEMVKTNVIGAMNVIEAAGVAGVTRVVALSTDKAFQPVSPYGQSKALAESLFLSANDYNGPRFAVTRYGNVSGSQGSVIERWKRMVATGAQRLPVTDLNCTRFHMTIKQAVELVWSTAQTMVGGELVIPRDLPAYHLGDLVEAFGAEPERLGLPDWEKLHENMDYDCCSRDALRLTVDELRQIIAEV